MQWSDGAIEFGPSPDGPWISPGDAAARSEPNGLRFAKVDTRGLAPAYGEVQTFFLPVVSGQSKASTSAQAIAGPSGIAVSPLGLCVMNPDSKRDRHGELEEYGFRRGISYDLMQLNPDA